MPVDRETFNLKVVYQNEYLLLEATPTPLVFITRYSTCVDRQGGLAILVP